MIENKARLYLINEFHFLPLSLFFRPCGLYSFDICVSGFAIIFLVNFEDFELLEGNVTFFAIELGLIWRKFGDSVYFQPIEICFLFF